MYSQLDPRIMARPYRSLCASILIAGSIMLLQNAEAEARGGFESGIDRMAARQERRDSRRELRLENLDRISARAAAAQIQRISKIDTRAMTPPSLNRDLARAQNATLSLNDSGRLFRLAAGVRFDLGSDQKNIVLGEALLAKSGPVTITANGESKTFQAGQVVTAAEYVAVKQALSGGQTLLLDGAGRATGGDVDLGTLTTGGDRTRASTLVNPSGVTMSGDFGRRSEFKLRGDLENFGSILAMSGAGPKARGTIKAFDIVNHEGASISSSIDLLLLAGGDIVNNGTIESTGKLDLLASGKIKNGANSTGASLKAVGDIRLVAPEISNNNFGKIQSLSSDVILDAPDSSSLMVNNHGGSIEALSRAIVIRERGFGGASDTSVLGGDLLSEEVKINSGVGLLTIDVNELTGQVSGHGLAAHVTARTDDLNLGEICLTGDPTFFNTGNININGNITVAEALTIIAEGNINLNSGSDIVAADANQGFPVTLIAGADITGTSGGANQGTLGPIPPANNNNGSVTLSGAGIAGGGGVIFSDGSTISTRPTSLLGNKNGGDVLIVAYDGANANSGDVQLVFLANSISTGGAGFGDNGNITVIADGNQILRNLDTRGGDGFGGDIVLSNGTPKASTGSNIVYQANGLLAPNSSTFVPDTVSAGSIAVLLTINAGDSRIIIDGDAVNLNGNVSAKNIVVDSNGLIGLNQTGNITAQNLLVLNSSTGIRNTASSPGNLSGDQVFLTATSGDIGESADFLRINSSSIQIVNAVNAFMTLSGTTTINPNSEASSVVDNLSIDGTGLLTVKGLLETVTGNVDINFGGNINFDSNSQLISGNDLTLNNSGGSIQTASSATIASSTGSVTVSNTGGNLQLGIATVLNGGSVSVNNDGGSILLLDSAQVTALTGATISNQNGGISLGPSGNISTATGNLDITNSGGTINIGSLATVSTGDGDLSIVNGTNKKVDKIVFGNGSTVSALGGVGFGNVLISVGASEAPTLGKRPKANLVVNESAGGIVFFGRKSITALAPNNILTAKGANLIFNNPINKKNIVLNGNVIITADPPQTP